MLEVACGLICSSIPALKPFVVHFALKDRLRKFLHQPRKSASKGAGNQSTYRSQSRLYSRPCVDIDSTMFDGATSVVSMAVVMNGRQEHRASDFLDTLKSVATITEEEESRLSEENDSLVSSPEQATVEVYGKDDMWINVRSSVTVIRGTADEVDGT